MDARAALSPNAAPRRRPSASARADDAAIGPDSELDTADLDPSAPASASALDLSAPALASASALDLSAPALASASALDLSAPALASASALDLSAPALASASALDLSAPALASASALDLSAPALASASALDLSAPALASASAPALDPSADFQPSAPASASASALDRRGPPEASPWDRLFRDSAEREARRAQAHEEAEAERVTRALFDQSLFPASAATSPAASPGAFIARQEAWRQEREVRLAQLREEAEIAALRDMQPPVINAASERIAAQCGHEGPIRGWDERFARYALRTASSPPMPMPMFQPNINISARGDSGNADDAGERLYSEREERIERLRTLTERLRSEELVDPETGLPFFHPHDMWKTDKTKRRSASAAAQELYAVAQAKRQRHAEMIERAKAEHAFRPEISVRSRRMVARLKDRTEKKGTSPPEVTAPSSPQEEKKVKIRLKDFLAREDLLLARRQRRVEERERDALREEQETCTFSPRINRHSLRIFEDSQQRLTSLSPLPNTYHANGYGTQPHLYQTPLYQHQRQEREREYEEEQQYVPRQESLFRKREPEDTKGSLGSGRLPTSAISPSSFIHSAPDFTQPNSATVQDSAGTQLIGEFEDRMNELIAEWRSLERV